MAGTIVIASGGHGSTFLQTSLRAHKRPDVTFGDKMSEPDLKLLDKPSLKHFKEFKKRTVGWYELDTNKTIEENMVDYLHRINFENKSVVLSGRISRVGKFFASNNVDNAVCLIRHPLHAMVSLLVHRHPEKVDRFENGLNSNECVEYYAKLWNDTVVDHIEAGNRIVRYEFAQKDSRRLKNDRLKDVFSNWRSGGRNYGVLEPKFEKLLEELVSFNYTKLYKGWGV